MPILSPGILESSQQLLRSTGDWDQRQLLTAAEQAELRNTGWPLGAVLMGSAHAPVPTADGIECRVHRDSNEGGPGWEDYWRFKNDGSYYIARVFEEEFRDPSFATSVGHPKRQLWFDVRVWRIAEVVLHSASLYRSLGIPPDEPYVLSVSHLGLMDREFWVSEGGYFVSRGKISKVESAPWTREVTQDLVQANLVDLVLAISKRLFVLFDFEEVPRETVVKLVTDFLQSRM